MRPGYSPSNMFPINYLVSLTAVSCIEAQFGNYVNGNGEVLTIGVYLKYNTLKKPMVIELKGQFTPKSNVRIFPLTFSAIYQ